MAATVRVFNYQDYKKFVHDRVRALPNLGRGEFARLAVATRTHKTTISQIFNGPKELTPEQAVGTSNYFGLVPEESFYFLLLVEHARAGSEELREVFQGKIDETQKKNLELSRRVTKDRSLSSEERATFYSSWMYSAVRMLSSIPGFQNTAAIGKRLQIQKVTLEKTVRFLLDSGLCAEKGKGLEPGPKMTHLESSSPLIRQHHSNWRMRALEKCQSLSVKDELAYTAPMTLSGEDVRKIREILAQVVERVDEIVGPSPSEKLFCLNIDWFEI